MLGKSSRGVVSPNGGPSEKGQEKGPQQVNECSASGRDYSLSTLDRCGGPFLDIFVQTSTEHERLHRREEVRTGSERGRIVLREQRRLLMPLLGLVWLGDEVRAFKKTPPTDGLPSKYRAHLRDEETPSPKHACSTVFAEALERAVVAVSGDRGPLVSLQVPEP